MVADVFCPYDIGGKNQIIERLRANHEPVVLTAGCFDRVTEFYRHLVPQQISADGLEKGLLIVRIEVVVEQTMIVAQIKKMETLHQLGGAQFIRGRKKSPGKGVEDKSQRRR
jgi:hypothetical protein